MLLALLTRPAVSPTGFSVRSLWALADFSDCSSKFRIVTYELKYRDDVTPARVYFLYTGFFMTFGHTLHLWYRKGSCIEYIKICPPPTGCLMG